MWELSFHHHPFNKNKFYRFSLSRVAGHFNIIFYIFFFFHSKPSVYVQLSLWKFQVALNYYIPLTLQLHSVLHSVTGVVLLTFWAGKNKVGHIPVPGSHTGRQRLPQLQSEGILPLGELQPWYQFRSRESPSLLVCQLSQRGKVPSRRRSIHNVTAFHLIWDWVFNDLQRFYR